MDLSIDNVAKILPNSGWAHITFFIGPCESVSDTNGSHFPNWLFYQILSVLSVEQVASLWPYPWNKKYISFCWHKD